ncbi:MAG: long-chain fatty acid--CoA ligase, partial [Nitratireductor sp.]|nr:long-chain fatty acid--CoA ligase [Nitratireductor sp.]
MNQAEWLGESTSPYPHAPASICAEGLEASFRGFARAASHPAAGFGGRHAARPGEHFAPDAEVS